MENLKPFLNQFVQFYYNDLGNVTGGHLHICLDDGNLSASDIWWCQQEAENAGDTFAIFLGQLMRHFSTQELEEHYKSYWGMREYDPNTYE